MTVSVYTTANTNANFSTLHSGDIMSGVTVSSVSTVKSSFKKLSVVYNPVFIPKYNIYSMVLAV